MSTVKKITIICPVHQSNDIRIYKKEALSLSKLGYQISIISKQHDYDSDVIHGIEHISLDYKNRLARFLSIPKIIVLALKERADVYHIHNPDTLPIGLFLKLFRKKVIYDTHENFHKKIHLRQWIPKLIRSLIANVVFYGEKYSSYFFDATIVTQKEQCHDYVRSCLIGNSPLVETTNTSIIKVRSLNAPIKLVYVGGISHDRGVLHMINLCNKMNDIYSTELYLVGPTINSLTNDDLLKLINQHDNIFYKGSLEQHIAFDVVKDCDYGLILLDDVADYSETSPNKLFEYMMLGTPFVATNFIKWQDLLEQEKAGFFVSVDEINDELASALIDNYKDSITYQEMAMSGIKFVTQKYNWNISDEPQLIELYNKVLREK